MGRMVQAPFKSVTIGADATQDLWSVMASATVPIRIHGWEITSDKIAAVNLELTLQRITVVGSGGTALTEVALGLNTGTIIGSARAGDTTPGTPGDILAGYSWENLGPVREIYTPAMRPDADVTDGIALVCDTALAFELSGWVCWEEGI